jgi:hypothetical protein
MHDAVRSLRSTSTDSPGRSVHGTQAAVAAAAGLELADATGAVNEEQR